MRNEPKNKLIEMARKFLQDALHPKLLTAEQLEFGASVMARFAQHVLDKQWTRTEDGLPPDGTHLFTEKLGDGDSILQTLFIKDGKWFIYEADYREEPLSGEKIDPQFLIAWCELPQPYVQPEKEGK